MADYRVGIIGAGGIAAKLHLPEMQTVDAAEVTLIAGRRSTRLQTLSRKFDIPQWTQDYDAVIADDSLDAVIIALPHPLHVPWGLKALAAGKHVLIQKPLSTSLDEADRFVEATEAGDRCVLALPYVARPSVLAARDLVAAGDLGRISALHARHSHGGPEVYYAGIQQILEEQPDEDLWFFDADQADVGALFDMGVYSVATLVTLGGSVTRVTARCATVDKPTQLEDTAIVILDFESGALGTAETGWCDAARTSRFSVHGTGGKLTSPGHDCELTLFQPSSQTDEDAPARERTIPLNDYPQRNAHQHWVDCIRKGSQPPLSNAATARHITEILLAALKSSRENVTVDIHSRLGNTTD
jgi:predicted dehydrogenase